MRTIAGQKGFVLLVTLFFLSCAILWGSLLLLALSDQYVASNDLVAQKQSRLLANSGWNLALQQMETDGDVSSFVGEQPMGTMQVSLQETAPGLITLTSIGAASTCRCTVKGQVRLSASAWPEVLQWPVVTELSGITQPSRLLVEDRLYQLSTDGEQPMAIGSGNRTAVLVTVADPLQLSALYIDGDLTVEAPLQADLLCVSGVIRGQAFITCPQIDSPSDAPLSYQIEVLERNL